MSANLGAEWRLPGASELTLAAELSYRSASRTRWADGMVHTAGAPERRLDLAGAWRALRHLRLRIGVRNVLSQNSWSSTHYSGAGDDWRTMSSFDGAPTWHFTLERMP